MVQLKVKVHKLNKRNGPVLDFSDKSNIAGVVFRDFVFEGEHISFGEMSWYRDRDGHYYWGDALEIVTSATAFFEAGRVLNYQKVFTQTDSTWFQKEGKGIKVAILDSGFFLDHPDLAHIKSRSVVKDFGQNGNTDDKKGHGTHVLGVMAAEGANGTMKGMVPQADYFLYKVIMDGFGFIDSFATQAVLECIAQKVDVINMSFNVPSTLNSDFHNAINIALANNILVVASAGEDDSLVQQSLVFPSQFNDVISIGAVSKPFVQGVTVPFNNMLDLILPFIPVKSCWINDASGLYKDEKGSSMATALISGIMAAMRGSGINAADVADRLRKKAQLLSPGSFNDQQLQIIKI